MQTYIAILRGINVGGKILKMVDLRYMIENMEFRNARTYIQSGNVFFQTERERPELLEQMIKEQVQKDFAIDVSVIILTPEKLERIIAANPFKNDINKELKFLHVTFLQTKPGIYNQEAIESKKTGDEEIMFTDEAVYLYCPHGYGNSKLTNSLFEDNLKVVATTRNWRTTCKLLELAKK